MTAPSPPKGPSKLGALNFEPKSPPPHLGQSALYFGSLQHKMPSVLTWTPNPGPGPVLPEGGAYYDGNSKPLTFYLILCY